jgi:hypothetical protein
MLIEEVCPFTRMPVLGFKSEKTVNYDIRLEESIYHFDVCKTCYNKAKRELELQSTDLDFSRAFLGLLMNGHIDLNHLLHYDTDKQGEYDLKRVVEEGNYPKTPSDKLDNLFLQLYKLQVFAGEQVSIDFTADSVFWNKYYFDTLDELELYFKALVERGLIEDVGSTKDSIGYRLTFHGLNEHVNLFEQGFNSNKVFIAMAFHSKTNEIRDAIKRAIIATGYEPVIVDESNFNADRTIVDEIISNIRKCKFAVCDFTLHRRGVYFESGFALGLGRPVIFTCLDKELRRAHFDTKSLPHIIYANHEELEKKLKNKIEAWIFPQIK